MSEAVELIGKALEQLEDDAEGWFQLGTVGQRLTNLSPEFDTRTFGHAKLSDLVEATGRFEINRTGQHVRLRPKHAGRRKRLIRAATSAARGLGGAARPSRGRSSSGADPTSQASPAEHLVTRKSLQTIPELTVLGRTRCERESWPEYPRLFSDHPLEGVRSRRTWPSAICP